MNPQLKKGVLELCVLSQLTKEDKYGYELTDAISREMSIAAGTLYMNFENDSRKPVTWKRICRNPHPALPGNITI